MSAIEEHHLVTVYYDRLAPDFSILAAVAATERAAGRVDRAAVWEWMAAERLWPYPTGGGSEGRWYPLRGSNVGGSLSRHWPHCLLPPDVYDLLPFPQVAGFDRYPWFDTATAAFEAVVAAKLKLDGGRR